MKDATTQAVAAPKVRFIRDVPASDDFFNTHTRLAEAIVNAVEDNSEIKVVGLLGRWGIGKSTVANKIVALLEDRKDNGFRVFTYDAWLHQSDPLRRSFLESLIGNLVNSEAIAKGKWSKELKKLSAPVEDIRTTETPVLSHDARWIGLSLVAVPLGMGLLDLDTLKEAFGKEATSLGIWTLSAAVTMVLAPALMWAWLYLKRRPWSRFFERAEGFRAGIFWRMLDENGEASSALQIFVDGRAKHTTTQTFRSIEPTSLEFGRMFQDIMREAADGGHRLVILIDNLDRVAEAEALGMWATIRSFFLASHETEDVKHESFHPTVILPIDRHAVEELFAGSEAGRAGGRDRARSFMDKTFDVTFEVTEPVNSDWREFLVQQMKGMFGSAYQPGWGFWTRRLFESQLTRQQAEVASDEGRPPAIVTPREINKLLNRVGTLYLQWAGTGIPVEVMALYVIRRDDIDRGLLSFLQSTEVEIAEVAPQWKRELAALHYGVEPDKAAQVLLEEPIRTAIIRRDEQGIRSLSPIPGFGETFEYATSNLPDPTGSGASFDILTNAVFLLRTLNGGHQEWATTAWRNLVSKYTEIAGTVTPTAAGVEIITMLLDHVPAQGHDLFVATSSSLLSRFMQSNKSDNRALRVAETLIQFTSDHDLPAPHFDLDLAPQAFIARVSEFSSSPRLWPLLRTAHDGSALGEALSGMLSADDSQKSVPDAVRCFTVPGGADLYAGDTEINFDGVAENANQLVREPNSFGGDAMSGIRVLAYLAYGRKEGRDLLIALVDDGVLTSRLEEIVAKADWLAVAEIIAILLWRGRRFGSPSAFAWFQYPQRDPNHLQRIVAALKRYFPESLLPILWGARKANILQSSFFETIIGHAVATDALGKFNTKAVLDDLVGYKLAVPYKLRDKFLEQVDRQSNFLDALEEGPLGPQIAEAADYLRRKGGEGADLANAIIRSRVEQADAAAWSTAILSGQEPYGIGEAFIKSGDLKFGRKSALSDALYNSIPAMIQNGSRDMSNRWFTLIDLVKPKHGKALLQALGEAIGKANPLQALHILKTGGVHFLKIGGFSSRPDLSVRMIILPQLDRKDGREWLKDNRDELAGWVQRADPKAREELSSALRAMLASKREDRRYTADILAAKWALDPSA